MFLTYAAAVDWGYSILNSIYEIKGANFLEQLSAHIQSAVNWKSQALRIELIEELQARHLVIHRFYEKAAQWCTCLLSAVAVIGRVHRLFLADIDIM